MPRLHGASTNHLDGTPNAVSEPRVPEPPEIGEIWHNAFFEDFNMNTPDIVTTLSGIGTVALGHAEVTVRRDGERTAFLGQSVGDAIEVSRRISDGQLGIPLNPAAGTGFLILKDGLDIPDVGPFEISILGPTPANLRGLIDTWNKWLEEHQHFLQGVIDDHEVDEDLLASSSHSGPIRIVEAQAENLIASSQRVTPPNVASLTLLVKEGNRRIILSGDADDVDITGGLETQGLMDANGRIHVDVFKVPHHGAANSYSDDLAERVIADNYVFCGNGEHDNPELDVVRGYVDARRRIAAANPGRRKPAPAHETVVQPQPPRGARGRGRQGGEREETRRRPGRTLGASRSAVGRIRIRRRPAASGVPVSQECPLDDVQPEARSGLKHISIDSSQHRPPSSRDSDAARLTMFRSGHVSELVELRLV